MKLKVFKYFISLFFVFFSSKSQNLLTGFAKDSISGKYLKNVKIFDEKKVPGAQYNTRFGLSRKSQKPLFDI